MVFHVVFHVVWLVSCCVCFRTDDDVRHRWNVHETCIDPSKPSPTDVEKDDGKKHRSDET